MKTTTLFLLLSLMVLDLWAQTTPTNSPNPLRRLPQRLRPGGTNAPMAVAIPALPNLPSAPASAAPGLSPNAVTLNPYSATPVAPISSSTNAPQEEVIPAGNINFQGVDLNQVLDVYAQLVGRTILRPAGLSSPPIVLRTQTPLTKSEAIEALHAVLAINGISVINVGDKFVKIVPAGQANQEGAEFNDQDASQLPDAGNYVTHIVQLQNMKPSEVVPVIQPFAKLANSILPIDSNGILVLRDNAENVKRMLEMIEKIDVAVPAEIVSEVIPIKYALATDIANALNTVSGGSGASTSIGGSTSTGPGGNGLRTGGATSNTAGNGLNQNRPNATTTGYNSGNRTTTGFGGATGGGAFGGAAGAAGGGNNFSQRLQAIISRASTGSQDQIQILGQTKIIADERSNALLVFATRRDMDMIKDIVGKLDVLLSQVLIESVIMGVTLDKGLNYGVSVAQNQTTVNSSIPVRTAGGMNNGQPFYNFISGLSSNAFPGNFTSVLPANNGLSYFGNIGDQWNVAVQAAASDNNVSIIQRPRIQTSQAKAASFFVGNTVPYITSTYYGNSVSGDSSSYSQLSVGIQLDVTPFINPDGLVVMDIDQEIDDISGYTTIDGNDVPNTDKRTLSSEIAVKDRDTVILGGFVRSQKTKNRSGVPILQSIPYLGALFRDSKDDNTREELIVLMRPTVLRTPELAAIQAVKEQQRLPGVSAAAADEDAFVRKQVEAERKLEEKNNKKSGHNDGFFAPDPDASADTNALQMSIH